MSLFRAIETISLRLICESMNSPNWCPVWGSQLSDVSWATTNSPAVVYVWPTTHRETARNAVVSRSTGIYDHLCKQL